MKCPNSLVLFRFAQGTLDAKRVLKITKHIAACQHCRSHIQMVQAMPAAPAPGDPPVPIDDEVTRIHESSSGSGRFSAVHKSSHVDPADDDSATRFVTPPPRAASSSPSLSPDTGGTYGGGVTYPSAGSQASQPAARAGDRLPQGTVVGRYMIVEPLGSGGLGDVYTAYDPELDRRVAIKLLRPSEGGSTDSSATSAGDRLLREAKALARLAHPNVVAVFDVGRRDDDVFVAMERIEGVTLSKWLRAETRPWREIRDVFLGAGRGLAAAHEAGIVHRDFKPQNVIVSADGRPRVLDFGLARAVASPERSGLLSIPTTALTAGGSMQDPLTLPGTVMGTPQFMAPEQFEGSHRSDAASDQFAFCVALWLALYGERPFGTDDIFSIIAAVRDAKLNEPKDRRGVPGWLHKVMLRGLAHDPARRFDSMHALLHAMQRDRRSRRRQWIALATVAVLSGVGAAAAAILLRPPVTQEQRNEIDVLAEEARAIAARSYFVYPAPDDADGITAYRKVTEIEAIEGPTEDLADARGQELRDEFADTLVRLGDRYYEREGGRAFAADYYAAALIFRPDDEHARSRTTLTAGELGALRDKAATGEFSEGELVAAASLAVLAVEDENERVRRWRELFARDDAPAESTIARLGALLGEREVAAIDEAAAAQTEPKRKAPPKVAVNDTAKRPAPQPEPEPEPELEPDPVLEDEPAEAAPAPARRDPATANKLAQEGMKAFGKGNFEEAEGLFHRALSHNARNAIALYGLGQIYFERGSYGKAVKFAGKAVSAAPKSGKYRIALGDAYFKTLAYESARREYEKARSLGHPMAKGRLTQLEKRLGG